MQQKAKKNDYSIKQKSIYITLNDDYSHKIKRLKINNDAGKSKKIWSNDWLWKLVWKNNNIIIINYCLAWDKTTKIWKKYW